MRILPVIQHPSGGYEINNSMQLDLNDYLTITPLTSGAHRKWTFSTWIKVETTANNFNGMLSASGASPPNDSENVFHLQTNGETRMFAFSGGVQVINTSYQETFDETDGWTHFCAQRDTDALTVTVEINGVVSGKIDLSTFVDNDGEIGSTSEHQLGHSDFGIFPLKGFLADTHLIINENYDSSYFINGDLTPKAFTESHGLNGAHFIYEDALNLGKNEVGDDWTEVNTPTQSTDVP